MALFLDPGLLFISPVFHSFFLSSYLSFFSLAGYTDYIWLSTALPIVLLSHGSHKALSNYNLARFLQGRLAKNTPTLLEWWGKKLEVFGGFACSCVWIRVCVCSGEMSVCVCVSSVSFQMLSTHFTGRFGSTEALIEEKKWDVINSVVCWMCFQLIVQPKAKTH